MSKNNEQQLPSRLVEILDQDFTISQQVQIPELIIRADVPHIEVIQVEPVNIESIDAILTTVSDNAHLTDISANLFTRALEEHDRLIENATMEAHSMLAEAMMQYTHVLPPYGAGLQQLSAEARSAYTAGRSLTELLEAAADVLEMGNHSAENIQLDATLAGASDENISSDHA